MRKADHNSSVWVDLHSELETREYWSPNNNNNNNNNYNVCLHSGYETQLNIDHLTTTSTMCMQSETMAKKIFSSWCRWKIKYEFSLRWPVWFYYKFLLTRIPVYPVFHFTYEASRTLKYVIIYYRKVEVRAKTVVTSDSRMTSVICDLKLTLLPLT